jgi:hypothetical protein
VITRLELQVSGGRGEIAARLAAEFPELTIVFQGGAEPHFDARPWCRPIASFAPFDRAVAPLAEAPGELRIAGDAESLERAGVAIVTRYQRLLPRRNLHSRGPAFDRLLSRHRAMHDVSKPLVRADLDHAIDTWHWVLRLAPDASLAVQAAALLHDIERLTSEADRRIEHHAPDYQAFKDAHARAGAAQTERLLGELGFDPDLRRRVAELIVGHEHAGAGGDARTLADADGLSFFSLSSAGFLDYFGVAHTCRKIGYTLARLSHAAFLRLPDVRLRSDVAWLLEIALAGRHPAREGFHA